MKKDRDPATGTDAENRSGIHWIMFIYFGSGICSLMDEVVWVRLLKLTLGNTVYASSIVVSVFMGGLALGALIMARYADRIKKRLRLYAILELLATLSALALPWGLQVADKIYQWLFLQFQASPALILGVQVVISAAILLVPTMIMGSTLPLLGRYVTRLNDRVGGLVGALYALNMLGAALGCFLAGFILIKALGVMGTLYVAAGINLLVACGGGFLSMFHDKTETAGTAPAAEEPNAGRTESGGSVAAPHESPSSLRSSILLLGFFCSGLLSIGFELIWMRSIVFFLGIFTYVFSGVLTVYLLGNVAGAWIGSRLARRMKNPGLGFGLSLTCLGAMGVLYIPWFSFWQWKVLPLVVTWLGGAKISQLLGVYAPLFHSLVLFFLPSLFMGIGFPLALQAWNQRTHKVGLSTGTVYGVNTIGAVLGGMVTGFLLIPALGVQLSITVLGVAGCWLGIAMLLLHKVAARPATYARHLGIAAGSVVVAFLIPSDLFERSSLSWLDKKPLAVKEGVTSTITVYGKSQGARTLASSGTVIAGDDTDIRSAQKTLGHLGLFLNPDAREVLSVGFGSGETTACLSLHGLDRIDCVEISPELVDVALEYFSNINLGTDLHNKVNMIYMDGKNYVYLTPRRYDIIINGADVPSQPGSAPMFAREHFRNTFSHLKPGGVFITKMHLGNITEASFKSILGTFCEVFPHVSVWFPTTKPYLFFYLAGSERAQRFSPLRIDTGLARPEISESMAFMHWRNSHDLLISYVADEKDIEPFIAGYIPNSDFSPYVEFNLGEETNPMQLFLEFISLYRRDSLESHIDWTGMTAAEKETWISDQRRYFDGATHMMKAHAEPDPWKKLDLLYEGLRLLPGHTAIQEQTEKLLPRFAGMLATGEIKAEDTLAICDRMATGRSDFGPLYLIRSWALQKLGTMDGEARLFAEKAVEHAPWSAEAQNNLGLLLLASASIKEAMACLEEAVRLHPMHAKFRQHLAIAYSKEQRWDDAIRELKKSLDINQADLWARCNLADMLMQLGRKEEAREHYLKILEIDPDHRKAKKMIEKLSKS
ncbi:MAG: fused MFS/spermidine synthase [Planctomycetota bacterium]